MSLIEYKGYRIAVSAQEQSWGFAFGAWCGTYPIWQTDMPESIDGMLETTSPSAYDAEKKALQAVKDAIDDALRRSGHHLRHALQQGDTHASH